MNGLEEKRKKAQQTYELKNKEINEESYKAYCKSLMEIENHAKAQI